MKMVIKNTEIYWNASYLQQYIFINTSIYNYFIYK